MSAELRAELWNKHFGNKRKRPDSEQEIIRRAKTILMSKYSMTEEDAYSLIRKTAMDYTLQKVEVAQGIIDTNVE